jgi:glucose/arabinose dehydrogenase
MPAERNDAPTAPAPLSPAAGAPRIAGGMSPARVVPDPPFTSTPVATFDEPWAMTFLPDGRLLVTEKAGRLWVQDVATGKRTRIGRVPEVVHAGQGGFADVVLHPQFSSNGWVYLSYAEAGDGNTSGAAVARAKLDLEDNELEDLQVLWRQVPKVAGNGHYGHRIAFDADGMLWITSSERQKFDPAQDMASNLGKIVRLRDDGSVPDGNPFTGQGDVAAQVWSLGHRNMLGIDFDRDGRLWVHEMGPKGGDELNLIEKGANYGYPIVSNGDHYDGRPIPDHDTQPQYRAPVITWTPVISPAGFVIYDGDRYPGWNGSGLIGGLSSQSLVRVAFDGTSAREAERFDMGTRIREVEQGPDGTIWLLEDGGKGAQGRLYRLDPRS